MHFNQLTPAEDERLALLTEELGEAIQAIGKIFRHGYENTHPDGGPTNRTQLERELGHVMNAMDLLCCPDNCDLDSDVIYRERQRKRETVKEYLHHQ